MGLDSGLEQLGPWCWASGLMHRRRQAMGHAWEGKEHGQLVGLLLGLTACWPWHALGPTGLFGPRLRAKLGFQDGPQNRSKKEK